MHASHPPSRRTARPSCPCSTLLLALLCLLSLFAHTQATPAPAEPAVTSDPASLPYQFYHTDGYGGNNAACWLSRLPFPPTEGVNCHLAHSISQIEGRQIWQCDGEQWRFCDGCRHLEAQLQGPKDLVGWKIQGC